MTPTKNKRTDQFGFNRIWGKSGWNPGEKYLPIHYGVDFSARPARHISTPCDGIAFGMNIGGAVGKVVMIIPKKEEKIRNDMAIYFLHTTPYKEVGLSTWFEVKEGEIVGTVDHHLHYEIIVSGSVIRTLDQQMIIMPDLEEIYTPKKNSFERKIRTKAALAGLNAEKSWERVSEQLNRHGIRKITTNYIQRASIPEWKQSKHLNFGGDAFILNPDVAGRLDLWIC